jgi:hypothetical protein
VLKLSGPGPKLWTTGIISVMLFCTTNPSQTNSFGISIDLSSGDHWADPSSPWLFPLQAENLISECGGLWDPKFKSKERENLNGTAFLSFHAGIGKFGVRSLTLTGGLESGSRVMARVGSGRMKNEFVGRELCFMCMMSIFSKDLN